MRREEVWASPPSFILAWQERFQHNPGKVACHSPSTRRHSPWNQPCPQVPWSMPWQRPPALGKASAEAQELLGVRQKGAQRRTRTRDPRVRKDGWKSPEDPGESRETSVARANESHLSPVLLRRHTQEQSPRNCEEARSTGQPQAAVGKAWGPQGSRWLGYGPQAKRKGGCQEERAGLRSSDGQEGGKERRRSGGWPHQVEPPPCSSSTHS